MRLKRPLLYIVHTHLNVYVLFPLKGMRILQRASDQDMSKYVSVNLCNRQVVVGVHMCERD